jgi:hypothetical protein
MRNITLLGTAVAALTATMLLASPASAQRDRDYYGDREHRGGIYMYGGRHRDHDRDGDYYRDRGHRGGLYMYGGRHRDNDRDRDYYRDRRPGIGLHVPGIGHFELGH